MKMRDEVQSYLDGWKESSKDDILDFDLDYYYSTFTTKERRYLEAQEAEYKQTDEYKQKIADRNKRNRIAAVKRTGFALLPELKKPDGTVLLSETVVSVQNIVTAYVINGQMVIIYQGMSQEIYFDMSRPGVQEIWEALKVDAIPVYPDVLKLVW